MTATDLKVMLAGEGPNDLGGWSKEPQYRDRKAVEVGAAEALLRKMKVSGWYVIDGVVWQHLKHYRSGGALVAGPDPETVNVKRLALMASEKGADVLAILRDADKEELRRMKAIEAGVDWARRTYPQLHVVGGVPLPTLEAWILALAGEAKTDGFTPTKVEAKLKERLIPEKDTSAYVAVIEQAEITCLEGKIPALPPGCDSLRCWLIEAHWALHSAP